MSSSENEDAGEKENQPSGYRFACCFSLFFCFFSGMYCGFVVGSTIFPFRKTSVKFATPFP